MGVLVEALSPLLYKVSWEPGQEVLGPGTAFLSAMFPLGPETAVKLPPDTRWHRTSMDIFKSRFRVEEGFIRESVEFIIFPLMEFQLPVYFRGHQLIQVILGKHGEEGRWAWEWYPGARKGQG